VSRVVTTAPVTLTRVHWHHPEWPAVALAAVAWTALAAVAAHDPRTLLRAPGHAGGAALIGHAALMSAAMMTPLVLTRVHDLSVSSLWRRRYQALATYLVGYLGVWTVVSAIMMLVAHRSTMHLDALPVVVGAAVLAVVVARSRDHVARLRRCAGTRPLALHGWRADRDCLEDGARMAVRCAATTWALMLAVVVQGGLLVMVPAAAVVALERCGRLRPDRALVWTAAVAVLAVVVTVGSLAGSPGPVLVEDPHAGH
jgi:hypothetical protein